MKTSLLILFMFVSLCVQTTAQTAPVIRQKKSAAPEKEWIIKPGTTLAENKRYYSEDRRYCLVCQADGNLVIYKFSAPEKFKAIWNTETQGGGKKTCIFQTDGNLVIYFNGKALWSILSDSREKKSKWHDSLMDRDRAPELFSDSWLQIQNDGNLVIYTNAYSKNRVVWASDSFEKN